MRARLQPWRRFNGSDADWDSLLRRFPDGNVFQSSSWSRHKADFGWSPIRLVSDDAAVQFLAKRRFGAVLLWSRGGPVGEPSQWNEDLARAACDAAGSPFAYVRLSPYRSGDSGSLFRLGWRRPSRPLAGTGSFELDLSQSEQDLLAAMSGNWSHNLRRGQKRVSFRIWDRPDPAEMAELYRALEEYKGLPSQHDEAELTSLLRHLDGQVLVLRADGADGRPVAMRACGIWADSACDLLAAASGEARKQYASYVLLWELLRECRARGVRRYDLGGADAQAAKGVYDFKKGTGAKPIEYLGEWERSRPRALGLAVNWLLASRGLGA